jgi:hypothetical protein
VFVVAPTGSNTGYVGNAAVTTVTQSKLLRAMVVGPAYGNLRSSSYSFICAKAYTALA